MAWRDCVLLNSLFTFVLLIPLAAAAAQQSGDTPTRVPLGEADRIALTTLLVSRHPRIASSPGLKASYYTEGAATDDCGMEERYISRSDRKGVEIRMETREHCDTDFASLYFLPHSERLGRGEAARVNCQRPTIARSPLGAAPPQWTCHEVTFREYVQLEDQVCEVRLIGDISTPALMAAREAGLRAIRAAGQPEPEALVVFSTIEPSRASGLFGTNDCKPSASVWFSLATYGDAEDPASWETKVDPR